MTTKSNNETLDRAENIIDIKAIEKLIVDKFETIENKYKEANEQLKDVGNITDKTKSEIEKLTSEYDSLYERMQAIEQKSALSIESRSSSAGSDFVKSDVCKDFIAGRTSRARLQMKTAIVNATGQNQPLVQSDRLAGIAATPDRILTIRDLIPTSSTSSNLVEFARETSFTNNAGPTVGGSPEAYENVLKPESAVSFALVSVPVVTLAHYVPASKQVLSDSQSLQSYIDRRLSHGLKLKEETQLLNGTGANGELNGLITQATSYINSSSPNYTNEIDIIRDAIRQAHLSEYRPDFVVLNPVDWFSIEIRKVGASDDRYIIGSPNQGLLNPTLWGLPVIVTNSIAAGTFLMGSSMAAEIMDREESSVEMSYENADNFVKNMITIRAEERLALCVYRTEAFITGSL